MKQRTDHNVLLNSEHWKRPHNLEGTRYAEAAYPVGRKAVDPPPAKSNGTAVGREHPGNSVEKASSCRRRSGR